MRNVANATDYLNMDNKELFKIYSENKDRNIRNILTPLILMITILRNGQR